MITPYFFPAFYYGGPVRVTYELARRLVRLGHEVTVLTTDVLDQTSRYDKRTATAEGVKIHYFKNISNSLACRSHAFLPIGFYSFLGDASAAYDVIHIHEYYTLLTVFAAKFAGKHGIPAFLSAHGSMQVNEARGNQGRKKIFNGLFKDMILGTISAVIALNDKERNDFLCMGMENKRIEIIPNGIDLAEFEALPDRMEFRAKYGIKGDERIILFVGRIHEIKGLDLLLRAFTKLIKRVADVKLVFVGPDDGYLHKLRRMAEESGVLSKVLFTGLLSGKEKLSAYSAANLFALPSRSEGFPVTVLEACASCLPVIVSEACNFREVEARGAGLEIKCDEYALYDGMWKLLNDPQLRARMGMLGKNMVRDNYDWNAIVKRLEHVYQRAVNAC